jgi:hypothetical protein
MYSSASMASAKLNASTRRVAGRRRSRSCPDRRRCSSTVPASRQQDTRASCTCSTTVPTVDASTTVKRLSGLAPSRTLTSWRPRVIAYVNTTRNRSARSRTRPLGKARKT